MTTGSESADGEAEKTYGYLRDKIKSKMDVAKLLGAFLTGTVSLLLAFKSGSCVGRAHSFFLLSGMAITLAAIVLFFATVIAYDRILMPLRYWHLDERADNDALQQLMVKASTRLFMPASACSGVGLLLLVCAFLPLDWYDVAIVASVVLLALIYAFNFTRRPRFGEKATPLS